MAETPTFGVFVTLFNTLQLAGFIHRPNIAGNHSASAVQLEGASFEQPTGHSADINRQPPVRGL